MQFKHPELLWGLLLLLIPIFIHLFQLRRFQKTPFTNVKFLKKVVSESRRSSTLKKWLLLFSRLLLLAALVLAFAQPFFAEKSALKAKEMVIYLDDSFSMQEQSEGGSLLSNAVQSLLKALPKEGEFSLFTNTQAYKNIELTAVQNDLLALQPTSKQLQLDEVLLKSRTFFSSDESTIKTLIVISDFQERFTGTNQDSLANIQPFLVQLQPERIENTTLDSVYLANTTDNLELTVMLSNIGEQESLPISLFNGEQLIAKTAAVFDKNHKAKVNFSLPEDEVIKGRIALTDNGLLYDNELYFSVNKKDKIKVLAIGEDNSFLNRIYAKDEFEFRSTNLKNLDYSLFSEQNLIVLNELRSIPNAILTNIKSFTDAGGKLVVIPANNSEINSYNLLASNYFRTSYARIANSERNITKINFEHPLYQNVFEKKVANFQYPKVSSYFPIKTNASAILSFQGGAPFLVGGDSAYFFAAAISTTNSNYKNSPLIVPTFYNIGKSSLKLPSLYAVVGQRANVDIVAKLANDRILKTVKEGYEFIPQQQVFSNKVSLSFAESPRSDGIYEIKDGEKTLQDISFNYDRNESQLLYRKPTLGATPFETDSITSLFESIEKDNTISELWKWLIILALFFMGIEVLIQKILK